MRIHHLSCGTMCPFGGRLMDGFSHGFGPSLLVCHCLLIEGSAGLILVDSGLGLRDVRNAAARLSRFFMKTMRVQLEERSTAIRQIEDLGFSARDVQHIVLTHLDFDHAGGIEDFPNATVHAMRAEMQAARRRWTPIDRGRYRPKQWDEATDWRLYEPQGGERWNGFEAVRDLQGLPPEILMVPLAGHTFGHAGVAIQTDRGWILHAGDAYFHHDELRSGRPSCPPGLRLYQAMMEVDRDRRLRNQSRLRRLARERAGELRIFCAHDAVEFDRMRAEGVRVLATSHKPNPVAPGPSHLGVAPAPMG